MASTPPRAAEVFIPYSYPELTYVQRGEYEDELREALSRKGPIVSLTGRSKSGKTVLVTRVITPDRACIIGCSNTPNPASFWDGVLNTLGIGTSYEVENAKAESTSYSGTGEVRAGLPVVGQVRGQIRVNRDRGARHEERRIIQSGPSAAIDALLSTGKTLVVDDFHYLQPRDQRVLGRQLKDAAFREVPVVVLSVPHHGDDPVRAVPDLVGRVQGISLKPWSQDELCAIADKGFEALGRRLALTFSKNLANESIGSPQLMQSLCLETCHVKGIDADGQSFEEISLLESDMQAILERTSRAADFTTLFRALQSGPRQRGRERTMYPMRDGQSGDVYHVVLAALSQDPLQTTISYESLKHRVQAVCSGDMKPTGTGIVGTVEQLSKIARESGGTGSTLREPAIEWLPDRNEVVLPDAYFLFYLRWQAFPAHSTT